MGWPSVTQLAMQTLGFVLQLAGFLLAFAVLVGVSPEPPPDPVSVATVPWLVLSVILLLLGGYVQGRAGSRSGPSARLRASPYYLGAYAARNPFDGREVGRSSSGGHRRPLTPPERTRAHESALVSVCPACGAQNEREFTFCGECAARLRPRRGPLSLLR